MNTSNRFSIALIATIFGATALMFAQAEIAAPKHPEIVKLERVVITGKRAGADTQVAQQRIEQLPRVVITGRRAEADLQFAQACAAQTLC